MLKKFAVLIVVGMFSINFCFSQNAIQTTKEFSIEGLVEKNVSINFDSLKLYPTQTIDSFVITNHLGVRKSTLKNLKVVALKSILNNISIKVESPKILSEFYFIFVGSDGYKVVYSWNEIFNTEVGKSVFIVIEHDGKNMDVSDDSILTICKTDAATGRRHVKSLSKILIKRAE